MSEPSNTDPASIYAKLRQLEGILRDVYRELGGAKRAIWKEREGYSQRLARRKRLAHNSDS